MRKSMKLDLFNESDQEDDISFKTNKNYAKHYDEFRKKELLSHLKNLSDDDSSSSEDASTDDEVVNPEFDKEFFKTLAYLKNKNPGKYENIPTFFENVKPVEDTIKSKQSKTKKPFTVVDFQRERLLNDDLSDDEKKPTTSAPPQETDDLTYVQEQTKLKDDLKKALDSSDSEVEEEKGGLFKIREKSKQELDKEQEDYVKWLAGRKKEDIGEDSKVLKPLKEYWNSQEISKEDKFLRDYILNKKYLGNSEIPTYEEIVALSEDEKEVEQQDEYEHKYNFRFEEPDSEFIKRYPRNLEDTVRVTDNKRKDKRKEREERKKQEKELKMKELKELQNIRKREIEEKLMLLKQISGNEELPLQEDDLNSEFDPDEHDRRMAKMFDNEYYGIDEGDQKPEFPEIDEEIGLENWDNFDKSKVKEESDGEEAGEVEENPHCEDDDFIMDCDFDPQAAKRQKIQEELITMTKGRKKRRKLSRLAQLVKREKPAFDPEEKTYEEYLDEYYKLDYEDIIADQPCRFKYTECVPNDFGLTVEEILMASNKELNQWASLKKTMQNRPKNVEMNDVEKYNRRRNNLDLKKKIFVSVYSEKNEEDDKIDEELKPTIEEVYKDQAEEQKPEKKEKKKNETKILEVSEKQESQNQVPLKKKKNKKLKNKNSTENGEKKIVEVPSKSNEGKLNKKKAKKFKETEITGNEDKTKNQEGLKEKKKQKIEEKTERTEDRDKKPENEVKKPQTSNNKGKLKKMKKQTTTENSNQQNSRKRKFEQIDQGSKAQNSDSSPKKKKFKKNKNLQRNTSNKTQMSDERLKAYGINPKKYKNKLKYGNKNQGNNRNKWKASKV